MKPTASAIIFDLDGTLIASLEDLADATNMALTAHSLPTHPLDPYRFFVGDGMETLVRRAAPEGTPEHVLAEVFARVKQEYGAGWARKTRPYDGIGSMLDELVAQNVPLAVLTNKPHEFTLEIVRHFFPTVAFSIIQGSPAGSKAKPDPTLALEIATRFAVLPEQVAFMGDSRTDMDTAVNAGMLPVGALWGFRPEEELRAHGAKIFLKTPAELFSAVDFV